MLVQNTLERFHFFASLPAMAQRANGSRTLPQIFINNRHIGGCDDLYFLEEIGSLDELLIFNFSF